jgi:hypothetical protein
VPIDIWGKLATGRVHGETLWAKRAVPNDTERLLAALDSDGRRHFLVLLTDGEPSLDDTQSRGLRVATRDLAVPGHALGRYLDVSCHDPSGHDAFQVIGGELADRLVLNEDSPAASMAKVLAKWRRFWGQQPRDVLTRYEQIGLLAELWFLSVWLVPRVGATSAVERWRGPLGARHDFEWPRRSIEVKATTSTRGLIHRINGIDQLVPPQDGTLLLFSLRLREEGGATNSLTSIVRACEVALADNDEALSLFASRVAAAGYSPTHEEEYSRACYRIVEEALFSVHGDFPRVTPVSLPEGLPPGVEHVEYDINLTGFDRLRVHEGGPPWTA